MASILSVQPNYRYTLQQSKTGEGIQYAVEKLKLQRAHELARGERVLVAVIDSGIDVEHPEMRGTMPGLVQSGRRRRVAAFAWHQHRRRHRRAVRG